MRVRPLAALALAASLAAAACTAAPEAAAPRERPLLGLMTTLPLLWAEAADVGELLRPDAEASWVRGALEERFVLEPLDTLDAERLAPLRYLILAQPRTLSPAENVALDDWVRGGGRLLLFADPMLTRHSRYPVGDRRRPQDVVLLSPILKHWGLDLQFDDVAAEGERLVSLEGASVPVDLPGSFALMEAGSCRLSGEGLLARCRIGEGEVVALADAALLDEYQAESAAALDKLLKLAFESRDLTG